MTTETPRPPQKLWIYVALIFVLMGLGLATYSTLHHLEVRAFGATNAVCNISARFNCDEVALSPYAEPLPGLPLGVFGFGYFLAQGVLLALGLRESKSARDHLQAYVAMVGIGLTTSVILAGISLGVLGTVCLTCMATYSVCLAQGGALFVARKTLPRPFSLKGVFSGGSTAALVVAATVLAFQYAKPSLTPTRPTATPKEAKAPALAEKPQTLSLSTSPYNGLGEDYRKGGDQATVVIQEFADFQCPGCARMGQTLDQLQREFGDRILVVFRSYPLDSSCNSSVQSKFHEYSCRAAVMARCAGQYGKFWPYHDLLFKNQHEMTEAKLKEWAQGIGLSSEQIEACWNSTDLMAKVKDDISVGNTVGVDSTPTIFINGRKVLGPKDPESLKKAIDEMLQNTP